MNLHLNRLRATLLATILVIFTILGALPSTSAAEPIAPPDVSAAAVYMLDTATGTPLYALNADERRFPASTTKIATAIVIMEHAGDLSEPVVIDASDVVPVERGESIMAIVEGDVLTIEQLLYGLLIPSGNDAAHALARVIGQKLLDQEGATGDPVQRFIDEMNAVVASMGLQNTHFANVHGLHDDNNYSSAHDMAQLAARALSYPLIASIVQIQQIEIVSIASSPVSYGLRNTNQLLGEDGFSGVKTGTLSQSGACLVASKDGPAGAPIIGVVLGSHIEFDENGFQMLETDQRFDDMRRLFRNVERDYQWIPVTEGDSMPGLAAELAVWDVQLTDTEPLVLPADQATELQYQLYLQPPGEPGTEAGTVRFYAGATMVAERQLVQTA